MAEKSTLKPQQKVVLTAALGGIFVNAVLAAAKLICGYRFHSMAIISDGYNNLSDIASALLIVISYRLARKPADRQHPYGHERIEYLASLIIGIAVLAVGGDILLESVRKLSSPGETIYDRLAVIMLILSIAAKVGLAFYYKSLYRRSGYTAIAASVSDSWSDVASSAVILAGYLCTPLTNFPVDAVIGILVSGMILYSGVGIIRAMSAPLIGVQPDASTLDAIRGIIMASPEVLGLHDLRVYAYGVDHVYGSCDVEVDGRKTVSEIHPAIDAIEDEIRQTTGVQMTLHMDPREHDAGYRRVNHALKAALKQIDPGYTFHDLHAHPATGEYHADVMVPYEDPISDAQLNDAVRRQMKQTAPDVVISLSIDRR